MQRRRRPYGVLHRLAIAPKAKSGLVEGEMT